MSAHDDNIERTLKLGELVGRFGGWVVSLVAIAITVVLWVQTQGDDQYYPKLAGENLEKQIARVEEHMGGIEKQNMEIIRILGRIEGAQSVRAVHPTR